MLKKDRYLFALMFFFAMDAMSQTTSYTECRKALISKLEEQGTMTAQIEFVMQDEEVSLPEAQGKGALWYRCDGGYGQYRFQVEVTTSNQEEITYESLYDGAFLHTLVGKKNEYEANTETSLTLNMLPPPGGLLFFELLEESVVPEYKGEETFRGRTVVRIEGAPSLSGKEEGEYKKITALFDKETGVCLSLELRASSRKTKMTYLLSEAKYGVEIDPLLFIYPPKEK